MFPCDWQVRINASEEEIWLVDVIFVEKELLLVTVYPGKESPRSRGVPGSISV